MPRLRLHRKGGSTSTRRLAFAVAAVVLVVDQVAKQIATRALADGPIHVVGGLHLQLYRNFAGPGGNWAGHTVLISIFTVLAALALVVGIMRIRTLDRITAIALGLFLGGALGNGLDRLFRGPGPLRGGVVDWLAPSAHGGSMNVADLALNAAVLLLLAGALLSLRKSGGAGSPRRRRAHIRFLP
jgi:signal peptidase II